MKQYIDKTALVAEIERILSIYTKRYDELAKYEVWITAKEIEYRIQGLKEALSILNTLEVKEVDLEKEIETHLKECLDVKFPTTDIELIKKDVEYTARMFFELGLQARIDKELVEEVYSHIDGIKDTADRMTSGNFMHNRAAIKFSANTIAKVLELMGVKAQKGE